MVETVPFVDPLPDSSRAPERPQKGLARQRLSAPAADDPVRAGVVPPRAERSCGRKTGDAASAPCSPSGRAISVLECLRRSRRSLKRPPEAMDPVPEQCLFDLKGAGEQVLRKAASRHRQRLRSSGREPARSGQGMKVAKTKGRLRGKQPKLKPAQEAQLVELWRAGKHTSAELAELFSVARSTVCRAVPARPTAMALRPRKGQPTTPDPRRHPGQRAGNSADLLRHG
jgi:hypothetical protein